MVFAKYPRPGDVKTRLVPPLTFEESSALYRAFLLDALDSYRGLGSGVEPVLYMSNESDLAAARELLEEGESGAGNGIEIRAQRGATLGERLESAFEDAFRDGCSAACAIGTDHPTLPLDYIHRALRALGSHDLAIGPADDGGYYLLGLRRHRPELFRGMPYSTPDLLDATLGVAEHLGLRTHILPAWYDVDDAASLRRLIDDRALLPAGSRTLQALLQLQRHSSGEIDHEASDSRSSNPLSS